MRSLPRFAEYSAVAPAACLIPPTCAPIAPPTAAPAGPPIRPPASAPRAPSGPPKTPAAAVAPTTPTAPLRRPPFCLRRSIFSSCLSNLAASAVACLNSLLPISKLSASSLKAVLNPLTLFLVFVLCCDNVLSCATLALRS